MLDERSSRDVHTLNDDRIDGMPNIRTQTCVTVVATDQYVTRSRGIERECIREGALACSTSIELGTFLSNDLHKYVCQVVFAGLEYGLPITVLSAATQLYGRLAAAISIHWLSRFHDEAPVVCDHSDRMVSLKPGGCSRGVISFTEPTSG